VRDIRHKVDGNVKDDEDHQPAQEEREKELGDVAVDDADHLVSYASGYTRLQVLAHERSSYLDSTWEKTFTHSRMALRVLLADESTTIKKVMQLALQDFAVEVKAVHAGVDVLDVARAFLPDIIFADVLLQKKNGYEVCAALKADRELKTIPVVLMWSSFMDLDAAQARSCGAEARLEKPFDVETLRKEVLELVPKTRSQRLAHFLEYSPKLNEDLAGDPSARAAAAQAAVQTQAMPPPPPSKPARATPPPVDASIRTRTAANIAPLPPTAPPIPEKSTWSMASFEDPTTLDATHDDEAESFKPLELSQLGSNEAEHKDAAPELNLETESGPHADDEAWSRQDLSHFKLDLPPISVGEGREEFKIDMGEEEFSTPNFELSSPPPEQHPSAYAEPAEAHGNDLTLESHEIANAADEIAMPLEPLDLEPGMDFIPQAAPSRSKSASSATPPRGADQMSAENLERIIRAQSREIIEQVVRKLVPDLAATIIREELERLLEDTAVRKDTRL
jgi:two-component system cell cycle response regulator